MNSKTIDSLMSKSVETEDGCWEWMACTNMSGYGQLRVDGRTLGAHRVSYELFVGPIPDGLELDHLCHGRDTACTGGRTCPHRRCVNPGHMEPVTHAENVRRGRSHFGAVTHCPHGHPYAGENLRMRAGGGRRCRACNRARGIAYRQRRRHSAA